MSVELFRRARRAEARAERAEDRRRLRLEFFRQALTQGFDSLKVRHAEGASGQESVRTHARLMDEVIFSLTRLIAADASRARLDPTSLVVAALGGYGRGELHPPSDIDLMVVYERELADKGLITPREQAATDAALTFLWRVRNELHFFSGHKNDVLSRDLQPRIAKNLGYENDDTSLGVERFMRDYYLHARAIHRVSRRLIARCQETLSRRGSAERRQRQQALADGLVFFDGQLHLADRDSGPLRADPSRLMKVFWHLHRLGCELSLDLERALEDSLYLADGAFQRSPVVRDLFLDVCRAWGRAAQTFSEMHELGLLGRYLPEWGALTCLVQYDVYHKFSVDQHSLLAVEHLEALAPGQSAESEGAAQVFHEVERPELLMLGMLLHDVGKARGHGHVAKGIPLIRELVTRMGLDGDDGAVVEFLVAHHLTMSHIAQRRDIDDPKTIADFAATVGDPQRLKMLYLLTWADMPPGGPGVLTPRPATSPTAPFRRSL